ncbi:MAG: cation:dicarboxylase symporter family transporter [Eubacterium sp.]|nr:cation:dicarboxylase symporter family transporter [Eubacterium sp.]
MKKKTKKITVRDNSYMEEATRFIGETMQEMKLPSKLLINTELMAEEMIATFVQHAPEGKESELSIRIGKSMGDISVEITMPGEEFDPVKPKSVDLEIADDGEAESAIRSILLNSFGEKLKYSNRNHVNSVRITAGKAERSNLVLTMIALALGIVVGVLAVCCLPESVTNGMDNYVLTPIKTIFMNALKIIVGPVVFFSIVTCVSQFKNLAELGRMGIKIMGMYMFTTLIALGLGLANSFLFQPGTWEGALVEGLDVQQVTESGSASTNLIDTIVNIVPSNLVKPFLESDTLQLIFLAVICGVAVGLIGKYSRVLTEIFEACNSLFLTITTMIARFIPLAVFCSVTLLVIEVGGKTLLHLLGLLGTALFAIGCMMLVYMILLALMGRVNPIRFMKNNREGMLTSFSLSSSNAAIPTNLRVAQKKMGVAPKLANFSIPLGATVNMDGGVITQAIMALFLAKMYGVEVSSSALISMCVTIVLLSMGAPGVPGAGIVVLSTILASINVPTEALGLVIGVYSIMDMFTTMSNTTGDMVATVIVANSEKLLDREVFYAGGKRRKKEGEKS